MPDHNCCAYKFDSAYSGYKILDRNIFLSIIYFWQISTDTKQKQICHRKLMIHTEIHQVLCRIRFQMIILYCNKQLVHLHVRSTKLRISMTLSCFLQNRRALNIRICRIEFICTAITIRHLSWMRWERDIIHRSIPAMKAAILLISQCWYCTYYHTGRRYQSTDEPVKVNFFPPLIPENIWSSL